MWVFITEWRWSGLEIDMRGGVEREKHLLFSEPCYSSKVVTNFKEKDRERERVRVKQLNF